jgi:hypothetical protein
MCSASRVTVGPLRAEDESALHSLLARHPYHDYRAYPRMPADAGRRLLLTHFAERGDRLAAGAVWRGETMVAAGLLEHLAWDSRHFGLAMGRLGPLVTDPRESTSETTEALVDWLLERGEEAGLEHVTVKVDSAELAVLQVLETRGFRLVDCLVTYFYDCRREPVPPMKQLGTIRDYAPSDLDAVLAIAGRMLGEYGGRFAFDPWLPREAVRRFYVEWTRNACAGHMADRLLVGERHGRIVGFLGYAEESRPLRSLGVRIGGHGISAVLPEGTGLYPAMLAKAIAIDRHDYDFAEFDTSVQNLLPQRIFQRMGFHVARTKYTLHRGRLAAGG